MMTIDIGAGPNLKYRNQYNQFIELSKHNLKIPHHIRA